MKLWFLRRLESDAGGFDTFNSMVVAAKSEKEARLIHPDGRTVWTGKQWEFGGYEENSWTNPDKLLVRQIGTSKTEATGVICASFNAG